MTAEQIRHARDLLTRPNNTVSSIARLLGVSRATIYKYVPEVTTGRQAVAAALPLAPKIPRHRSLNLMMAARSIACVVLPVMIMCRGPVAGPSRTSKLIKY
jgi:predicted transcriptional regulator